MEWEHVLHSLRLLDSDVTIWKRDSGGRGQLNSKRDQDLMSRNRHTADEYPQHKEWYVPLQV